MSFGEAVVPVQSLNLVHGVTEMREGEAKKEELMNRHGKRGTLEKGTGRRKTQNKKKEYYISLIKDACYEPCSSLLPRPTSRKKLHLSFKLLSLASPEGRTAC